MRAGRPAGRPGSSRPRTSSSSRPRRRARRCSPRPGTTARTTATPRDARPQARTRCRSTTPPASPTSSASAGRRSTTRPAGRRSSRCGTTARRRRGRRRDLAVLGDAQLAAATRVPGIALPGGADYRDAQPIERAAATRRASASRPPRRHATPTLPAGPRRLGTGRRLHRRDHRLQRVLRRHQDSPDGWTTIGGTSSSTPIWAATLALVNASPACAPTERPRRRRLRRPLLYAVASRPGRYSASLTTSRTATTTSTASTTAGCSPPAAATTSPRGWAPRGSPAPAAPPAWPTTCAASAPARRPTVTRPVAPRVGRRRRSGDDHRQRLRAAGSARSRSARRALTDFQVISPTSITATLPPPQVSAAPAAPAPQDGAGPAHVIVTLRRRSSATGPGLDVRIRGHGRRRCGADVTREPVGGSDRARSRDVLGSGFTGATAGHLRRGPRIALHGEQLPTRSPSRRPPSPRRRLRAAPTTGVYAGETNANDICQVQVRVVGPGGTSATGRSRRRPRGCSTPRCSGDPSCRPGAAARADRARRVRLRPGAADHLGLDLGGPGEPGFRAGGTVITDAWAPGSTR